MVQLFPPQLLLDIDKDVGAERLKLSFNGDVLARRNMCDGTTKTTNTDTCSCCSGLQEGLQIASILNCFSITEGGGVEKGNEYIE